MDCMRGSLQSSRAWKIRTGDALARLVAIAFVLIGITSAALNTGFRTARKTLLNASSSSPRLDRASWWITLYRSKIGTKPSTSYTREIRL